MPVKQIRVNMSKLWLPHLIIHLVTLNALVEKLISCALLVFKRAQTIKFKYFRSVFTQQRTKLPKKLASQPLFTLSVKV